MATPAENLTDLLILQDVFDGLTGEQINRLASLVTRRTYAKDEYVFREGDPGESAIIVESGRVGLFRAGPKNTEVLFSTFSYGASTGKKSMFKPRRREGAAKVLTDRATVCEVSKTAIDRLLTEFPDLRATFDAYLSGAATLKNTALYETLKDLTDQSPFFTGLKEAQRKALIRLMVRRAFAPGDVLFSEGNESDAVYLIFSGQVRITATNPDGTVQSLGLLRQGAFVGERGVLRKEIRTATATAITPVIAYRISSAAFDAFLEDNEGLRNQFETLIETREASFSQQVREKISEVLAQIRIFQQLKAEEIDRLAGLMVRETAKQGQIIFNDGDPGDGAYLLHGGRVTIERRTPQGQQITLAVLSRGDFFGERAIVKREPRSAAARASSEEVVLYKISNEDFDRLLTQYPHLKAHFEQFIEQTAATNLLRTFLLNFFRQRMGVIALAFVVLVAVIVFYPFRRPPTTELADVAAEPVYETVTAAYFEPGPYTIDWRAYATAEADRTLSIPAPFPGKVVATYVRYPGQSFVAGAELLRLDATDLELKATGVRCQLAELALRRELLVSEIETLKERIAAAETAAALADAAFVKQQEVSDLKEANFEAMVTLYENGRLSDADYTREVAAFRQAELNAINAENARNEARIGYLTTLHTAKAKDSELRGVPIKEQQLQAQLRELERQIAKAAIRSEFSGKVVQVSVSEGQEAVPGTPLAVIRSDHSVRLTFDVPDSRLRWLDHGSLLRSSETGSGANSLAFEIHLVNVGFEKTFSNGYLLSIGNDLHPTSRSLAVVIGRENPRDAHGEVLPGQEILPGMYCRVDIPLAREEAVIVIPRRALTENGTVYQAMPVSDTDLFRMVTITGAAVLDENETGVVVKLDSSGGRRLVVVDPPADAVEGMTVRCVIPEDRPL